MQRRAPRIFSGIQKALSKQQKNRRFRTTLLETLETRQLLAADVAGVYGPVTTGIDASRAQSNSASGDQLADSIAPAETQFVHRTLRLHSDQARSISLDYGSRLRQVTTDQRPSTEATLYEYAIQSIDLNQELADVLGKNEIATLRVSTSGRQIFSVLPKIEEAGRLTFGVSGKPGLSAAETIWLTSPDGSQAPLFALDVFVENEGRSEAIDPAETSHSSGDDTSIDLLGEGEGSSGSSAGGGSNSSSASGGSSGSSGHPGSSGSCYLTYENGVSIWNATSSGDGWWAINSNCFEGPATFENASEIYREDNHLSYFLAEGTLPGTYSTQFFMPITGEDISVDIVNPYSEYFEFGVAAGPLQNNEFMPAFVIVKQTIDVPITSASLNVEWREYDEGNRRFGDSNLVLPGKKLKKEFSYELSVYGAQPVDLPSAGETLVATVDQPVSEFLDGYGDSQMPSAVAIYYDPAAYVERRGFVSEEIFVDWNLDWGTFGIDLRASRYLSAEHSGPPYGERVHVNQSITWDAGTPAGIVADSAFQYFADDYAHTDQYDPSWDQIIRFWADDTVPSGTYYGTMKLLVATNPFDTSRTGFHTSSMAEPVASVMVETNNRGKDRLHTSVHNSVPQDTVLRYRGEAVNLPGNKHPAYEPYKNHWDTGYPVYQYHRFIEQPFAVEINNPNAGSSPNRPPQILSSPPAKAYANSYQEYRIVAADPEGQNITYGLVSGPPNVTVDPYSGSLVWLVPPDASGTYAFTVSATDSQGAVDFQTFNMDVRGPNHMPVITSTPSVDVEVGDLYEYDITAHDPDGDPIQISYNALLDSTASFEDHGDGTATLAFTASDFDADDRISVTIAAKDPVAASTTQQFEILVHSNSAPEDVTNVPPVITSRPKVRIERAGDGLSSLGDVSVVSPLGQAGNDALWLDLDDGVTSTATVDFSLQSAPPLVDVMLLLDDTASFQDVWPSIQGSFAQLADDVEADFPTTNFGFGVSRFEDYAIPESTYASLYQQRPFILNQPILSTDTPRFDDILRSALARDALGDGGDATEAYAEALFQLAVGQGYSFTGASDPSGDGYSGSLRAQWSQLDSGDVPSTRSGTAGEQYAFDADVEAGFRVLRISDQPSLPVGITLGGVFEANREARVFRHQAQAGQLLQLDFQALSMQLSGFTDVDAIFETALKVYSPAGLPIAPVAQPSATKHVYQLPETGQYAIVLDKDPLPWFRPNGDPYDEVRLERNDTRNSSFFPTEYSLEAQILASGAGLNINAFDPSGAVQIAIGQTTDSPSANPQLFEFDLTHAEHLLLASGDLWELLGPDGTVIQRSAADGRVVDVLTASPQDVRYVNWAAGQERSDSDLQATYQVGNGILPSGKYYLRFAAGTTSKWTLRSIDDSTRSVGLNSSTSFDVDQAAAVQLASFWGRQGHVVDLTLTSGGLTTPMEVFLYTPSGRLLAANSAVHSVGLDQVPLSEQGRYTVAFYASSLPSTDTIQLDLQTEQGVRPELRVDTIEPNTYQRFTSSITESRRVFFDSRAGEQFYFDGLDADGRVRVDAQYASGHSAFSLANSELNRMLPTSAFDEQYVLEFHLEDLVQSVATNRLGGGGFRPGALPIVVLATDSGPKFQHELKYLPTDPLYVSPLDPNWDPYDQVVTEVTGVDGTLHDLREMVGDAFKYAHDCYDETFDYTSVTIDTPYENFTYDAQQLCPAAGAATIQETIDALVDLGALVVGIGADADVNNPASLTLRAPRAPLEQLALLTGAVNASSASLTSNNIPGSPIAPQDPLYIYAPDTLDAAALKQSIRDAVGAALTSVAFDVQVRLGSSAAGIATIVAGEQFTYTPGDPRSQVQIDFTGDGGAHHFYLEFLRKDTEVVFGRIPIGINHSYSYDVQATDADGDVLYYSLVGETHGASINPSTGEISWLPPAPDPASPQTEYAFTVQVSDGRGGVDQQVWVVEVADPNAGNVPPEIVAIEEQTATVGRVLEIAPQATDANGDALRYQLIAEQGVSVVPDGMVIHPTSGLIRWLPDQTHVNQSFTIQASVNDGRGGEATETFEIFVKPDTDYGNRRPSLSSRPNDLAVVNEQYTYELKASDPDGDLLTFSLPAAPDGMVIDPLTRTLAWSPSESDIGEHPVLVVVSDGHGGTTYQNFVLRVSSSNLPPVFESQPGLQTLVSALWTYSPLLRDPNGDDVKLRLTQAPAGMRLVQGQLQWTPTSTGTYDVEILAEDQRGGEARQKFTLQVVTEVIPPPVLSGTPQGPAVIGQEWTYTLTATPDGSRPMNFQLLDAPAGMTIAPNAVDPNKADVRWVPSSLAGNYRVQIWVSYVSDSTIGASQRFELPVTLANTPPVIRSIPYDARVGNTWTYAFDAVDPDGDPLEYELLVSQPGMTIDENGLVTWTPTYTDYTLGRYAKFQAPSRIVDPIVTIVARDGFGGEVTDEVSAVVQPPIYDGLAENDPLRNVPFVRNNPTGPIYVDEPWTHQLLGTDPNGDSSQLIYRFIELQKDGVALLQDNGTVTVTADGLVTIVMPSSDNAVLDVPSYDYVFEIEDEEGLIRQYEMRMRFRVRNTWPEFSNAPSGPIFAGGQNWQFDSDALDPDPNTNLSFGVTTDSVGTIAATTGVVSISQLPAAHSVLPLTLRVSDGSQLADGTQVWRTQANTLIVSEAADGQRPEFHSNPPVAVRVGEPYSYQVSANDPNSDPIAYRLASGPAGMSIDETGWVTWTPDALGNHAVVIELSDGTHTTEQRYTVSAIKPYLLNEPPEITSVPVSIAERDVAYEYQVTATDANGDVLEYALVDSPAWMTINTSTGKVTGTPTSAGQNTIVVQVREVKADDSAELLSTQKFALTTLYNARPRITSVPTEPRLATIGQTDYTYQVTADDPNDEDDSGLKYSVRNSPAGVTIDAATGLLTFSTSDLALRGRHAVSVRVTDPSGAYDEQQFTVQALDSARNDAPEFVSKVRTSLVAQWPYVLELEATDQDGDEVTFTLGTNGPSENAPTGAVIEDGLLIWTPPAGYLNIAGGVTIHLVATSARDGLSTTQTTVVDITGTPVNSAPDITSAPLLAATSLYRYAYAATATDADNDALFWQLENGPSGMVIDSRTGLLTWGPSLADVGDHAVKLSVSDGYGGSQVQEFTLTVRGSNLAPTFTSSFPQHIPVGQYSTTATATDLEQNTPLLFRFLATDGSGSQTTSWGMSIDFLTADVTWNNQEPHNTVRQGTLQVRDSRGATSEQPFTFVTYDPAINSPPQFDNSLPAYWVIGGTTQHDMDASDVDLDTLSFSLVNPPDGMQIDSSTGVISWELSKQQPGIYPVTVQVYDGQFLTNTRHQVDVRYNDSPTIADIEDVAAVGGQTIRLRAIGNDPNSDDLTYSAFVSGGPPPTGFEIDPQTGDISWTTPPAAATTTITVRAFDPYGSYAEDNFTVTTTADIEPPGVQVSFSPATAQLNSDVLITVSAQDDVAVDWTSLSLVLKESRPPNSGTWTADGTVIQLDDAGQATVSSSLLTAIGSYRFEATATDSTGNVGTSVGNKSVLQVVDGAPIITLKSPTYNQEIYELISVFGTIDDPQDQLVSYTVEVFHQQRPNQPITIKEVASGAQEITDGTIAVFDPTLLDNGLYTLVVTATDSGENTTKQSVPIFLEGNYKPGVLSLSFTDLELSTADIPLTISRSYSSARADVSGDFGYGWSLDLGIPEIEIAYPPEAYQTSSGRPMLVRGTRINITLPDGTREGFTFDPVPEHTNTIGLVLSWLPYFAPDKGNTSFLDVKRHPLHAQKRSDGTDEFVDFVTRQSYDPALATFGGYWKVITQGGPEIFVDASREDSGWLEDRNGNKTTIDPSGIRHWSGRSIRLTRDAEGRITQVMDPLGNAITYTYNASGELESVTDRAGAKTRYGYDSATGHEHFLTTIHDLVTATDPVGRQQLVATYHPDNSNNVNERNRLASLTDAEGWSTSYGFALAERSQTIDPGADGAAVADTTVIVDRRGNPVYTQDPAGVTSRNKYDSLGKLIEQRQIIGSTDDGSGVRDDLVSNYQYNQYGQPITVTDARGLSTSYNYNDLHLVSSVATPDGQSTRYYYDRQGNLTSAVSPIGEKTELSYGYRGQLDQVRDQEGQLLVDQAYDNRGQLIATTDTEGRITQFEYDSNGNQTARITRQTDGNGVEITIREETDYDAMDRVVQRRLVHLTPDGQGGFTADTKWTTTTTYDPLTGQVTSETDQRGLEARYRYDRRGNQIESLRQVTLGDLTKWAAQRTVFDDQGRVIWSTDAYEATSNGQPLPGHEIGAKQTLYDAAGRSVGTRRWIGATVSITGADIYQLAIAVDDSTARVASSTETEYDSAGRVWRSRDAHGLWTENFYGFGGEVVQTRSEAIDENGNTVHLVSRTLLDDLGRPLFSGDTMLDEPGSDGKTFGTKNYYDAFGRTIAVERRSDMRLVLLDRFGAEVTDYSTAQGPFSVRVDDQGTLVGRTESIYDAEGRLIRSIAATGAETRYEYDDRGRQIRQISTAIDTVDSKDALRHVTETEYDDQGRAFRTWTNIRGRDLDDQVLLDKRSALATTHEYDELGRTIKTTYADGSTAEFTYDDFGNVLTETDSAGNIKQLTYDDHGRLSAVQLPAIDDPLDSDGDAITTADIPRFEYTYDWAGNQTLIKDSLGRDTTLTFDAAGRQLTRTLPEGNVESWTYNDRGQQIKHVSFEGVVTEFLYDNGTTHLFSPDADDAPTALDTAHANYATGTGRLMEKRFYSSAAVYAGGTGTPDEVWQTTYDALGRQISVVRSTNTAGTLTPTRTETTIYDTQGRVVQASSPEGVVNYAYDPVTGQPTRMWTTKAAGLDQANLDDAIEDTRYSYNALGWLTSLTVVEKNDTPLALGSEEQTDYGYDLQGRQLRVDLPSGVIQTTQVNQLGAITQVRHYGPDATPHDLGDNPLRSQFDYELTNGQRTKLTETFYFDHDNNSSTPDVAKTTTYDWVYDANNRLLSETIDHHNDDLDRTESFTMDLFGNRLSRTVDYAATSTLTDQAFAYLYDDNDRLITETLDNGNDSTIDQTTTYDWGQDSTVTPALLGGTQQLGKTVKDSSNNTISTQTFSYNLQGRLAEVVKETYTSGSVSARTRVQYEYDSSGIRIRATEADDANLNGTFEASEEGNTTEYLIDHRNHTGYAQTIVETTEDSSGQPVKRIAYTFGTDEITQTVTDYVGGVAQTPVVHTFGHDAHGSVRVLLDAAGALAQAYTYAAYGELLAIHNTTGTAVGTPAAPGLEAQALTTLLYSGESFDSRIGQQYLRARWYDTAAGRFSRLDPYFGNLNDPLSFNKYLYGHSNGIMNTDPTGLLSLSGLNARIGSFTSMVANSSIRAANFARYRALDVAFQGFLNLDKIALFTGRAFFGVLKYVTIPSGIWVGLERAFYDKANPISEGVFNTSLFALTGLFSANGFAQLGVAGQPTTTSSWANYRRTAWFSRRYLSTPARTGEISTGKAQSIREGTTQIGVGELSTNQGKKSFLSFSSGGPANSNKFFIPYRSPSERKLIVGPTVDGRTREGDAENKILEEAFRSTNESSTGTLRILVSGNVNSVCRGCQETALEFSRRRSIDVEIMMESTSQVMVFSRGNVTTVPAAGGF